MQQSYLNYPNINYFNKKKKNNNNNFNNNNNNNYIGVQ